MCGWRDGWVLGGRQVTECFVQSLFVVEADPVQDFVLGVFEAREAAPVDELALEGRDPGLGHGVDAPIVKYSLRERLGRS
jgi:hypothetical protein